MGKQHFIHALVWTLACTLLPPDGSPFVHKYRTLAHELAKDGKVDAALAAVERALERDPNDLDSVYLQFELAKRKDDRDRAVYALHHWLTVARKRKPALPHKQLTDADKELLALDPEAKTWSTLAAGYVAELLKVGKDYERRKDLLAALGVYQHALQVDGENTLAKAAIINIRRTGGSEVAVEDVFAGGGDPTAGLSEAKLAEADKKHASWDNAWTKDGNNYSYKTNAGFMVLETSSIAMEQMNRFYRKFFHFQEDGGKTPKIEIRIFKTRDEYLKLGSNPVEWSGGQFTGSAVETYVGGATGKETIRDMYRTLFHEAAHQFVSLAIPFVPGWLNEAYASFFEGCSILSNGSVDWNKPAMHRLFPLAARLERGFMASASEDIKDSSGEWKDPEKAPTLRIVVQGDYEWGPPWYAPTWGVVYFLYNYRDDKGRAVYRDLLHEYALSFRRGRPKDPIAHFEEVVLAGKGSKVKSIDELNTIWRDWILELRDRASGRSAVGDELLRFGDEALARNEREQALAFYEEARDNRPDDLDLLAKVCKLLDDMKLESRAAGAYREFKRQLELRGETTSNRYQNAVGRMHALDPLLKQYTQVKAKLAEQGLALAKRYEAAGLPTMALLVAHRMSGDFSVPEALAYYTDLAQRTGKTLARWRVAYDEHSLAGWSSNTEGYEAYGETIRAEIPPDDSAGMGKYLTKQLIADVAFDGDFSLEAEMRTEADGEGGFRGTFMGLCFGVKDISNFHAVILHPKGFIDISTNRGGAWQFHEHRPTAVGNRWCKLRIDVAGQDVDVYLDGLYLRSMTFPGADTLRGSFGLISGVGRALYRNVRMLARDRNDPSATIERKLAMAKVAADASARVAGSFVGIEPPPLQARVFVQGAPVKLSELRGKPVLLAFWSVEQDRAIPSTKFYNHLAEQGKAAGLVTIVFCDGGSKEDTVKEYLGTNPLPGAHVALDDGHATLRAYAITGMPFLLLIDRDGKVVYQGTPGFEKEHGWQGGPTFVDDAFKKLLEPDK
jgi:tetratricopeptide (TPR) repeat protein